MVRECQNSRAKGSEAQEYEVLFVAAGHPFYICVRQEGDGDGREVDQGSVKTAIAVDDEKRGEGGRGGEDT